MNDQHPEGVRAFLHPILIQGSKGNVTSFSLVFEGLKFQQVNTPCLTKAIQG